MNVKPSSGVAYGWGSHVVFWNNQWPKAVFLPQNVYFLLNILSQWRDMINIFKFLTIFHSFIHKFMFFIPEMLIAVALSCTILKED